MKTLAKPGPVLIQPAESPKGEVVSTLTETLGKLDPASERAIRARFSGTYLLMSHSEDKEDGEWWYEEQTPLGQKQSDMLLDHVTSALQKVAPRGHYFAGRRDEEGVVTWGFWPKANRNQKEPEEELLFGGFSKNRKPVPLDGVENAYKYRGREIYVSGSEIVIARSLPGEEPAVLAEWDTAFYYPLLEAFMVVDLHQEHAKMRGRRRPVAADVPEAMRLRCGKGLGAVFRYRTCAVDLQPIGMDQHDVTDLSTYGGMACALVLDPDDLVVDTVTGLGTAVTLERAAKACAKIPQTKPSKGRGGRGRSSFLSRMLNL